MAEGQINPKYITPIPKKINNKATVRNLLILLANNMGIPPSPMAFLFHSIPWAGKTGYEAFLKKQKEKGGLAGVLLHPSKWDNNPMHEEMDQERWMRGDKRCATKFTPK
jgi:hypothetical protein